jgi:hypothetical protein
VTAVNSDGFTISILEGINLILNAGGSGYAVGDTGTVTAGDSLATYVVLTVSGGAVTLVAYTGGGSGYANATGVATATGGSQPGAGTGLTVDVTVGIPTTQAVVVTATCHA